MQILDADADRKERAGIILGQEYSKKVSILMLRLSLPAETALSDKVTRNRTILSFKDNPRKLLGQRQIIRLLWRFPKWIRIKKKLEL